MAKSVILSEDTVRGLLEAHASMAAWYYELARALQSQSPARTPDDATRAAFLARAAEEFPEIAAVARTITAPRVYVPAAAVPPPADAPQAVPSAPTSVGAPAEPPDVPPSVVSAPSHVAPAPPAVVAPPAQVPGVAPVSGGPSSVAGASGEEAPPPPPPLVVPGTVKY
jgi:hypothetical protein